MPTIRSPMRNKYEMVKVGLVVTLFALLFAQCSKLPAVLVPRSAAGSNSAGQPASLPEIEQAIETGLLTERWQILSRGPGSFTARIHAQRYMAEVLIQFNGGGWTISRRLTSPALQYQITSEGERIHSRYNDWVRRLDTAIRLALRRLQIGA